MGVMEKYREWSYRELETEGLPRPEFVPHQHQKEAWRKLDRSSFPRRGLLVFPTGGGKTKAIVHWLLRNVLSEPEPRRVLWIAHRAELIQQATQSFWQLLGISNRSKPLVIRCISGSHGKPITALLGKTPADVSLCTIQSMSRRPEIVQEYFNQNRNCVIVVDEAHHAAAKTYRDVLSAASRYRKIEILGLTATPTRTVEAEIRYLTKLFPDGILYQTDQVSLIQKGILSNPIPETVKTHYNFDRDLTRKELAYLRQFGDLPASVLNRIGRHTSRNKLIVNHYLDWQSEYGQTLVFATNIIHCYALADAFREEGIRADYVASKRHDRKTNESVVRSFRKGEIDVLISVAILTEGVDLPNVKSVFLARPTGSEILMKQMVGRGMRGPRAGGHSDVYIVSFADHWERFPDWLDPVSMLDVGSGIPETRVKRGVKAPTVVIPWELISAASSIAPDIQPAEVYSSLPLGWYQLRYGDPDLGRATAILVYDQQQAAFEKFVKEAIYGFHVMGGPGGPLASYFADVPDPRPSHQSLETLVRYIREFGRPTFISFEDRKAFDPDEVARKLKRLPVEKLAAGAEEIFHNTLARECYRTEERYTRAVVDAVVNLEYGKERVVDAPLVQTKRVRRTLPYGTFPLRRILEEVRKRMKLRKRSPDIRWSRKPLKSSWGFYRESDQIIVINQVLKTTAISSRTMEFLVYHELLHHELGVDLGHNSLFRAREREFPGCVGAEAELDTLIEQYRIEGMDRRVQ